jgi:general secretion pathway protein D
MKVRRMRWICMAALLPAIASAQFDFGGGAATDKPWETFHLNPKTRVKLDYHSGSSWDAIINFFESQSGVTIVKDPTLTGTTSLTSARAVPLSDAFQILSTTLTLKGFSLSKQGNLLVIKAQNKAGGGPGGGGPNIFTGGDTGFGPGGNNNNTELKVYHIEYANASALAKVLSDVYAPSTGATPNFQQGFRGGQGGQGQAAVAFQGFGGGGGRNQPPVVKASPDDFSNSVIVNAAPSDQIQVASMIKELDKPSDLPQHTKVYHLQYAAANDTAPIVQNVLTTNVPRGRGGATSGQTQGPQAFINAIRGNTPGSGQVVADPRTNSIVVTATDDDMLIVDKVVNDLDKPVTMQSTTFVFPLANARAEAVASLLQSAFGNRQGVTAPNASTSSQFSGSVGAAGGKATNVQSSPNSGTRTGANLQGSVPDDITQQYAMQPTQTEQAALKSAGQTYNPFPSFAQQASMRSAGQNYLPIQLQDPTADSGELMTNIGIAQGFGGFGGGGGGFRGGQSGSSSSSTTSYNLGHLTNGQVVPTQDPTGAVTAIPDYNTNSIIVVTSPENAEIVRKMLAQLDKIPQQVMIQTIIVEATLDKSDRLGVEYSFAQGLGGLLGTGATGTSGTNFGVQSANVAGTQTPGFTYQISSKNLSVYLSALASDTRFQVLSTPRIMTTNNVQAQINVSQSIPYITSVQSDSAGNPTYSYSFLSVGVILTIQPRILSNGYVTLDVDQSANELQGYQNVGNTQAPVVNQREAQSTVSLKDGETIILGGIISKQVTATVNKVPLLGDIPILGNLFRSTSKDTTKTELLVFMTPHVINNPEDAKSLTNDTIKEMAPDDRKALGDFKKNGNSAHTGEPGAVPGTGSGTPPKANGGN